MRQLYNLIQAGKSESHTPRRTNLGLLIGMLELESCYHKQKHEMSVQTYENFELKKSRRFSQKYILNRPPRKEFFFQ